MTVRLQLGARFNRLTFLGLAAGGASGKHRLGMWRCDCGNQRAAIISRVKNGYTTSCGCARSDAAKTHGMSETAEYSSWTAMIGRCHSPTHSDYPRYGALGVLVCSEWRSSFKAFYAAVGPRPAGTTLDRIDNFKGYEPGNVRWATPTEQARNRRIGILVIETPVGVMPLGDYASYIGITTEAARRRLKLGKLEGCRAHH